jgi:hypothetical protein
VDAPVLLGAFSPGGDGEFDRSALRLEAFEGLDGEAAKPLVIEVIGHQQSSLPEFLDRRVTFTLYNTHSLPIGRSGRPFFDGQILEEAPRAIAHLSGPASGPRSRFLSTEGDMLAITYREESGITAPDITPPRDLLRSVLRKHSGDGTNSTVEPRHELRNPWDAPFFYGDSRHLFYVTTAEHLVRFLDWSGFTPGTVLEDSSRSLPRLVQPEVRIPSRPVPSLDGKSPEVEFGDNAQVVMRRFVSEDAYIRHAIGSPGTVRFGTVEIGPAGGLRNGNHRD